MEVSRNEDIRLFRFETNEPKIPIRHTFLGQVKHRFVEPIHTTFNQMDGGSRDSAVLKLGAGRKAVLQPTLFVCNPGREKQHKIWL